MIVSFLQILQESVTKLLPGGPREAATLPAVAIGALAATVGVKGIIWFGCIRIKTTQVQALAQGTIDTSPIWNLADLLRYRLQDRCCFQHIIPHLPSFRAPT